MFCVPELIFGGTYGVGSRFHVLRSRSLFRRCGKRRVPFSYFAPPDSFSAVSMASSRVFMLCVPVRIFGGSEGVGSHFHGLRSGLVFGGFKGVVSGFHVLLSRTHFRRYRRRRVSFLCFALLGLVFGGTVGACYRFHILCARTHFRRYLGHRVPFSYFARTNSFSAVSRASCPICMFCTPEVIFGGTYGVRSRFHVFRSRTRFRRF
jgi:hypothetical protein